MAEKPSSPQPQKPAPPTASLKRARKQMPAEQQAMAAQARPADEEPEEEEEDLEGEGVSSFLLFAAVPSWLISMVVHIILLLMLALVSFQIDNKRPVPPTYDIAKDIEDEEIVEFEPQEFDLPVADTEEIAQEPVIVEEVPEVVVDTSIPDQEAAPMEVALDPLSEMTAPRNDSLLELGAYTGTGLQGRGAARAGMAHTGGGTKASEEAVDLALMWLANHQNVDGGWSFDHRRGPCQNRCDRPGTLEARNGATGLALLPFLGAGHTHMQGDYQDNVKRGLDFLLQNMSVTNNRGSLSDAGNMYSHGICSIVLCEAYAMTNDSGLAMPAQMVINHIVYAQDPVGGGWRYQPKEAGDTSAVGWQLMALTSARMAYLEVPDACFIGASHFLDAVQQESGAQYGYTTPGAGSATTAVGLLCRMYLGWKHDHPALERGVQFLSGLAPSQSNMYYNYYATQVLHHYEGEMWEAWNEVMRDWLVNTQSKEGHEAGSWFIAGDHGSGAGGRIYSTAMATMILEVYYRHMPLYQERAAENEFPL